MHTNWRLGFISGCEKTSYLTNDDLIVNEFAMYFAFVLRRTLALFSGPEAAVSDYVFGDDVLIVICSHFDLLLRALKM